MSLDTQVHDSFRCELAPERERVRVRPVAGLDVDTVPVVKTRLSERGSTGLRVILEWDPRSRADGFAFSLVAGPPTA